jgi:hypothetical protein
MSMIVEEKSRENNGLRALPAHTMEEYRPQPGKQPEQHLPPPESHERQPLPDVLDILARRVQFQEDHRAGRIIGQRKRREVRQQQANELKTLYAQGTNRDKLIIEVYTTMAATRSDSWIEWTSYIRPQKTRDLIARVAPMTEDELREELRKAQEVLERKTAGLRKRDENWWRYRNLTPEERRERQREDQLESARRWRQRRKEQARATAEQGQPTEIFPHPPAKQ